MLFFILFYTYNCIFWENLSNNKKRLKKNTLLNVIDKKMVKMYKKLKKLMNIDKIYVECYDKVGKNKTQNKWKMMKEN